MPDTAEYLTRIRSYTHSKDPLELQRETPALLDKLLANASSDQLNKRPGPNKWSIGEILAHLADDEIATAWRYRQMVEHNGIELAGFDQDLWAELSDYSSWEPQDALALFRLLREANLKMFAQLRPEQWDRHGVHAERGKLSVRSLCRHMAAHDINHINQIRRILKSDL